jgi:hypothetical protein
MNSNERLTYFLRLALEKVSRKEFKKPSEALIESLPQIIQTCTLLLQEGTPAERKQALELIGMFWGRLMKDETAKRKASRKPRKIKPTVISEITPEQFADLLTKIEDSTADRLHTILAAANRRYHGG